MWKSVLGNEQAKLYFEYVVVTDALCCTCIAVLQCYVAYTDSSHSKWLIQCGSTYSNSVKSKWMCHCTIFVSQPLFDSTGVSIRLDLQQPKWVLCSYKLVSNSICWWLDWNVSDYEWFKTGSLMLALLKIMLWYHKNWLVLLLIRNNLVRLIIICA